MILSYRSAQLSSEADDVSLSRIASNNHGEVRGLPDDVQSSNRTRWSCAFKAIFAVVSSK
jgi:hypothetical protein